MWQGINPRDQVTRFDPHGNSVNNWQEYRVPKGARLLQMITVGSGGNGGNGFGAAAGTARGGGGAGAGGAISRLLIPAEFLPELLFVQAGDVNSAASTSRINVAPVNGFGGNTVLYAASGGNGGNGSATAAGAIGAAASIATVANTLFQYYGTWTALAGPAGVLGGAHTGAAGVGFTYGGAGILLSSGTGGAGCTAAEFAGGAITGAGLVRSLAGGLVAGAGNTGFDLRRPLLSSGGTGGGSSNTVPGGAGGKGGPGSGGGGGGAGVTTGGVGGRGGKGFVIITAIF